MADGFHYRGMFLPKDINDQSWHQFEIFAPFNEEPIGTYTVILHSHTSVTTDEKIAQAHLQFSIAMQRIADAAEQESKRLKG